MKKKQKKIADARTALEKRYEKLPELYPEMLVPQDWEARTMETDKVTLLSNPIEPENKAPNMWYALNQVIRKEAEHDKTYSRVMTSGGMYEYGENYEPREKSWKKKIYYGIFRVITVPIRKFL